MVIGVVTVAVVPVGVVTVPVATGVLTATVAATVTGGVGIGRVGRETVGARSVVGDGDGATLAVDEVTGACSASPPKTCLGAGTALTLAPPAVLR